MKPSLEVGEQLILLTYFLTVISYDTTLTPRQCLQNNPLGSFSPNIPPKGRMFSLHPEPPRTFKSKIFIHFILSLFFCLLKIVLQILASFDIKITIVCKMLATRRLLGRKRRLLDQNALDRASFSFSRKTKQTKANTFAILETLCPEPSFQQHRLGWLTSCRTT